MKFSEASRSEFKQFSAFSKDFTNQDLFKDFLAKPLVSVDDLINQAKLKLGEYSEENRIVLTEVLDEQLDTFASDTQKKNLSLLKEKSTVTITTGHQLTLFAGPLYLLYKAFHVIKLTEEFNKQNSGLNAVPVFWMASEDHDFDEIANAQLFNQELKWISEQSGAVGRMKTTDLNPVFEQMRSFFEGKEAAINSILAVIPDQNYAKYFQRFLSELFADYGLLVLQPDDKRLKRLFVPTLLKELASEASMQAVEQTNLKLQVSGYSPQAMVKNCNLFLLSAGKRSRIDRTPNGFAVDGKIYSQEELVTLVANSPESFSPNVILRPVYQETILPNICYVGGGGEMAYWVQLKGVFESKGVSFPLLAQRNSVILIDGGTEKKMNAMHLSWEDFKNDKEQLKKEQLAIWSTDDVDFSSISSALEQLKNEMLSKATSTDKSLESFAEAEVVRLQKQIENFEQRIIKQVKQKNEVQLKQIDGVSEKLFPQGGLQERHYHWLHFAPSGNYKELFAAIYAGIEPFNSNFLAIRC